MFYTIWHLQEDVPTFPTDSVIHKAGMAFVTGGRHSVHEDIVTGLVQTWLPWLQREIHLVAGSTLPKVKFPVVRLC